MPYDNDLSRYCDSILEMLRQGTIHTNSIVLVQADRYDVASMRRYVIQSGEIQEFSVEAEDSSDVTALEEYLDWAYRTVTAEHWIVVVVGHGGNITEISPDSQGREVAWSWMKLDQFCFAVRNFQQRMNQNVELLYFQNCNRGNLETFYEARHCARYTLASQLLLGAPNGYYQEFLRRLDSLNTGKDAAIAIMDTELPSMYHSLTLVDNQAVEQLPIYLSSLLRALNLDEIDQLDFSGIPVDIYAGDRHYDALMLFEHLTQQVGQGTAELAQFEQFIRSSLVAAYRDGGAFYENPLRPAPAYLQHLSGVSLGVLIRAEALAKYRHLALYSMVELEEFYRHLQRVA